MDDVDFTVAGSLERHVPGTEAGPTFNCLLMEQFYRGRVGDRYFFESANSPNPFTEGEYWTWLSFGPWGPTFPPLLQTCVTVAILVHPQSN